MYYAQLHRHGKGVYADHTDEDIKRIACDTMVRQQTGLTTPFERLKLIELGHLDISYTL